MELVSEAIHRRMGVELVEDDVEARRVSVGAPSLDCPSAQWAGDMIAAPGAVAFAEVLAANLPAA
jgi:hypothetical protein